MISTTLTCPKCKETKSINHFPKNKAKPSGFGSWCKSCNAAPIKTWFSKSENREKHKQRLYDRREQNKKRLIDHFGNHCLDCGGEFDSCCYDFHHLDGSIKERSFGNMSTYSWANIEREIIQKCVMLCANCHRIRHHG